jgi:hypothetical protein
MSFYNSRKTQEPVLAPDRLPRDWKKQTLTTNREDELASRKSSLHRAPEIPPRAPPEPTAGPTDRSAGREDTDAVPIGEAEALSLLLPGNDRAAPRLVLGANSGDLRGDLPTPELICASSADRDDAADEGAFACLDPGDCSGESALNLDDDNPFAVADSGKCWGDDGTPFTDLWRATREQK